MSYRADQVLASTSELHLRLLGGLEWVGRAQARAMMGAPKCCSHTSRGVCVPEEIDSVFLFCFGGHFFRCSINQKLPKVTKYILVYHEGSGGGCSAAFVFASTRSR